LYVSCISESKNPFRGKAPGEGKPYLGIKMKLVKETSIEKTFDEETGYPGGKPHEEFL